jgi:3'-phosphoadenosine 5'-phosphosulfate sulfotransferase (PAPS reductase)/FAD synthetase
MIDIKSYDNYLIGFSGGKDSLACLLHLLDQGVDRSKIELWHHDIDGEGEHFMDWPVTKSYCQAVANHFDIPIYFSWKSGGFKREMLRNETPTAPTYFEIPPEDNDIECGLGVAGGKGPNGTRRKFPQVSANLSVRWCSAYLKIDVCSTAIRNQKRFNNSNTLVITGERANESAARAKYNVFEPDRTDNRNGKNKRLVDRYRPVHSWTEYNVWDIIGRYGIVAHPAYQLGWGRLSCMKCIFGSDNQWASAAQIDPNGVAELASYETEFGVTIHRSLSIDERVNRGTPYDNVYSGMTAAEAMSPVYVGEIHTDDWELPSGAFGESDGPT